MPSKSDIFLAKERAKALRKIEYSPELCMLLVEHMKRGMSFETFSVKGQFLGSSRLDKWAAKYKEFGEAKEIGRAAAQFKFEEMSMDALDGELKLHFPLWYANMKNRFGWSEKVESNTNVRGELTHLSLMDYIKGKDVERIENSVEGEEDE